jgi:hypothetical protein
MNVQNFLLSIFILVPQIASSQQREKMLIVSPASFSTQLNAYMTAKQADKVDCKLIIVDSAENFQTIKQKIATVYAEFQADFLLLIGDFQHIPSYPIDEGLSDMQYGILSDDDAVPAMVVGRFSVETAAHLQTMIERSLAYKNCSKTAVGIASQYRSELTQLTDYEQVRKMNAFLENKGFRIVAELFDGINEVNPTPRDVINVLNQGITWVNYAGYGNYQGWNTSGFSNQHIDSLQNSEELPIILSAACLNGHFAQRECFAEKWLRATSNGNPIGARAVVMSSLLADWDATLSGMLLMCENLPASENNCRLGTLYLQAYLHISNELQRKKEAKCWLLFGDPSLWIYPPAETKIKEPPTLQSDFLYPNPSKNTLISSLKGRLQLFDLKGNLLSETIIQSEHEPISIKDLPTGIYTAILYGENMVRVQKVVIW